jgi:hypothetical protein
VEPAVLLTHMGCPACGGALSLAEGQRLVTCRYCGAKSLALIPDAVPRYVLRLAVTSEEARWTATQFLKAPALPRALRERGRIQDLTLCYLPFYEASGTRLGTFLLREREKPPPPTTEGDAQSRDFERWLLEAPKETQDTRVVQQDYVRVGPACDLPELGVDRIQLEELRRAAAPLALESYDPVELQRHAVVFAPAKPPAHLAEETERRMAAKGDRTRVAERRVKLLYYPVWQARYEYRGRPYEIAIDGIRGTVLRARAPREFRRAAALAIAMLAIAAFCLGRPARGLLLGAMAGGKPAGLLVGAVGALLGFTVGGAAAFVLAWIAWTTFRQDNEMLFVEGEGAPRPAADLEAGGFQRIATEVLEQLLRSKNR